jgi:hypothetical protein
MLARQAGRGQTLDFSMQTMKIILFPELYDEKAPSPAPAEQLCSHALAALQGTLLRTRRTAIYDGWTRPGQPGFLNEICSPEWLFLRHETFRMLHT